MKYIEEYIGKDIFFGLQAALIICITLLATGCASTKPEVTPEHTLKAGMLDGAIEAAKAPLFKMTCPLTGCVFGSLEVGNPNGAGQMAEIVKVALTPQPSEASQNFRAVLSTVSTLGGYAIIGNAASNIFGKVTEGFAAGFKSNVDIANRIPQPGAVNTTTTTTSNTLSGTGVLGSGTYNAPITNTTTNPSPKVCTPTFSATGAPNGFNCTGG